MIMETTHATVAGSSPRRNAVLVSLLLIVSGVLCVLQYGRLESTRQSYQTKRTQLAAMQTDAARIESLRDAPRKATDRQLPHEQLVAEIEQACTQANLPLSQLESIWPEAPRRIPKSDYQQLDTCLRFERTSLQQVAAFVHQLETLDASITLESLRLASGRNADNLWDVELVVAYLLYAPEARPTGGQTGPLAAR